MIIVDVETSGVDPNKHSILSIGALDFDNPENVFCGECRIWDGARLSEDSLKICGFTPEEAMDKNKKTESELISEFLLWLKGLEDHTIAGHNPFFDFSFIQAGAKRGSLDFFLAYRSIDLHTICYYHMKRRGLEIPLTNKRSDINSDFVMRYVGIPNEPKPHKADNGARYEAEAFNRFLKDKYLFEEFSKYPIPWLGK